MKNRLPKLFLAVVLLTFCATAVLAQQNSPPSAGQPQPAASPVEPLPDGTVAHPNESKFLIHLAEDQKDDLDQSIPPAAFRRQVARSHERHCHRTLRHRSAKLLRHAARQSACAESRFQCGIGRGWRADRRSLHLGTHYPQRARPRNRRAGYRSHDQRPRCRLRSARHRRSRASVSLRLPEHLLSRRHVVSVRSRGRDLGLRFGRCAGVSASARRSLARTAWRSASAWRALRPISISSPTFSSAD